MRPIATDNPAAWFAGVIQSVMRLRCAKPAERIKVLFGMKTWEAKEHYIRLESRFPPWIRFGLRQVTLTVF